MCLVKPVDFATAIGIPYGTIRSKITRGQLLRNKNKLIDTENPINFIYLLEVNGGDQSVFEPFDIKPVGKANVRKKVSPATKIQTKVVISKKEVVSEVESKNENPSKIKGSVSVAHRVEPKVFEKPIKLTAQEKREQSEAAQARKDLLDYDLRQKKANAEYKERETELKTMQLEKIAGNTLPLDLTKKILKINCQAILVQFLSSVENMVAVTVEELGGVRADNVRITNELKKIFKKTVENCEKNAEREIESAVAEYSDVRARGERK